MHHLVPGVGDGTGCPAPCALRSASRISLGKWREPEETAMVLIAEIAIACGERMEAATWRASVLPPAECRAAQGLSSERLDVAAAASC